jgi:DNA-binding NarL/FixJ family response regulator
LTDIIAEGETGIKWAGRAGRVSEPQRVVLFIARLGTVSESLVYALEHEFPWVLVEQVESVEEACASFAHSVSLILVDAALLKAAEARAADLSLMHPQALTAVIEIDDRNPAFSVSDIFGSRLVRGVLPMNLRLDVWLSVVRLMLRGGEYFPAGLVYSYAKKLTDEAAGPPGQDVRGRTHMGDLTAREVQILEMVSRGLQNKSIAAAFQLSEHTVKIHLHNIISKLGAHNRTEAAARFRDLQTSGL